MVRNTLKAILGAIRFLGLAVLILLTLSASTQAAIYPEAKIIQLSSDSDVKVRFDGASSAYNDMFGIYDPIYKELFWGYGTGYGTEYNLGTFPAGTELVFFIKSPGGIGGTPSAIFKTGPASRNPDNQVHGAITELGDQTWRIGFEDLWGGGDRDYNDIQATVKGNLYMVQPNPLKPDLVILPGDISFNNSNPAPGVLIEINATIRNLGKSIGSNVIVTFYDGNPDADGQLIATETINGISKEEKIYKTVIWDTTAKTGTHNIFVKIDPGNLIDEVFENNNVGSKIITFGGAPIMLPGKVYAITTQPKEPVYRQSYSITLSVQNPNSVEQLYVLDLKDDLNAKGKGTQCSPTIPQLAIGAHSSGAYTFECKSDWDWIPADKVGWIGLMKETSKMLTYELWAPVIDYYWAHGLASIGVIVLDLVDTFNLGINKEPIHEFEVALTDESTPDTIIDMPFQKTRVKIHVPDDKQNALLLSVVAKHLSSFFTIYGMPIWYLPAGQAMLLGEAATHIGSMYEYQMAYDPDFNYTAVQEPIPMYLPELNSIPDGSAKELAISIADFVSLRNATLTAYVRADGAKIDRQWDFAVMQLEAANNFTVQSISKTAQVAKYYKIITSTMKPLTDEQIQSAKEELQTNGLPQIEIDILTRNGLGDHIEDITQSLIEMDPELYRNPKDFNKYLTLYAVGLSLESSEYIAQIINIKIEHNGFENKSVSDVDIAYLEGLKSQINQSINQGTATPETKALIDEMVSKSREVLDETNNLAYLPYYEFAVSALAILPALDNIPPEITITAPANGTSYILNQNVLANWQASDLGSGIDSVTATTPNGSAIDTSTVGTKNFTVCASDNSGNQACETATYYVVYKFIGPLPPFNPDGSITKKAGSTVPVKIQVQDANGNNIIGATVQVSVIDSSGNEDNGTSAGNANVGNLFRQTSDGIYMYNLKIPSEPGTVMVKILPDDEVPRYATIAVK